MKLHCAVLLFVFWLTWTTAQITLAPSSNNSTAPNPNTNITSTTAAPLNATVASTAINVTSAAPNVTAAGCVDKTSVYDQKHKILLVVLSDVNVREFGDNRRDTKKQQNATSVDEENKQERNSKPCATNKIQTTIEMEPMRCAESQQHSNVLDAPVTIVKPSKTRRPVYYEPIACESIPRDESLLNSAFKNALRPPQQAAPAPVLSYAPDARRPKDVQASIQPKARTKGRRSSVKTHTKTKQNSPSYGYPLQTQLVNRYLNPYKYLNNYDYADQYDYSAFANPWQDCNSQDESITYDDYNNY